MTTKVFPSLIVLIPALILSTADAQTSPAELQSWSVEQLCGARDNPDAWDELERREIFRSRDLRTIRKGQVQAGMTEEALFCSIGRPEVTLPVAAVTTRGERFEAYVYPTGATDGLVYVRHAAQESTVAHVEETDDPLALASDQTRYLFCPEISGGSTCSLRIAGAPAPAGGTCSSSGSISSVGSVGSVLQPCPIGGF